MQKTENLAVIVRDKVGVYARSSGYLSVGKQRLRFNEKALDLRKAHVFDVWAHLLPSSKYAVWTKRQADPSLKIIKPDP